MRGDRELFQSRDTWRHRFIVAVTVGTLFAVWAVLATIKLMEVWR